MLCRVPAAKPSGVCLLAGTFSAITWAMPSSRRFLIGPFLVSLTAALLLGGAAHAQSASACIWGRLTPAEHTRVLAAYQQSMAGGAEALDALHARLRMAATRCGLRGDVSSDWIPTMAGSEAVQAHVAATLKLDRAKLDAIWAAAPANVAACVRANGRLAFFPNGTGCTDPAASAWLLKQVGIDRNQQPAAQQAIYYFNAKAIGEWGDKLIINMPHKPR